MDVYNCEKMAEQILKKLQEANEKLVNMNVMVLGKTGVGKSTLINNVFREKLAETGIGKPITKSIRQYKKEGFPLTIYDTPGFELGGENSMDELLEEICEELAKGIKSGDVGKAIHCIWYCVSTTSHRFEEAEKRFLSKFLEETNKYKVPVILILTQSYSKNDANELMAEIEKENLSVAKIVKVLAENFEIDEDYVAKAYGLEQLISIMEQVIPEAVKNTLVAVQKSNISLKQTKAQLVVATTAAAAAATGAMPIPFSDAALLVPVQVGMLAEITAVFGVSVEKAALTSVISATIGTMGATVLGKTIVSGLIKLIPGAGSVVGEIISASVAAALTAALGEAYIGIMTLVVKGEFSIKDFETKEGKEVIAKLFKEKLRIKRNSKGQAIE